MLPDGFQDRRVCVVGLGYVGLTLATTLAEVGFQVTGVEIHQETVAKLIEGHPHFREAGLDERLARVVSTGALKVSQHIPEDCDASVWIITVGTPLDDRGRSRLDMIERATKEVAAHIHEGDLVILRSTVRLGTTDEVVAPLLEGSGRSFHLAFCPERTLEGRAMEELRKLPQIVGANDYEANVRAAQLFQFVTPTVVKVSDARTAELIKLVDNAQRDVMFAYANEVARMCDAAGLSAIEVIEAGRLGYPRNSLPIPGPVGGPCLEKDPHILVESFEQSGIVPAITLAARTLNEEQPAEVARDLRAATEDMDGFPDEPVIAILGLAFKGIPPTDDVRGTMARPVLEALRDHFPGAQFRSYDPEVGATVASQFPAEPCETLDDAVRDANLVLVLTNHPAFASMAITTVATSMAAPSLIYDFWNLFTRTELELPAHVGYMALGSHRRGRLPGKVVNA